MTPKAAAALERVEKFAESWKKSTGVSCATLAHEISTAEHVVLTLDDLKLVLKLAKNCNLTVTGPHT